MQFHAWPGNCIADFCISFKYFQWLMSWLVRSITWLVQLSVEILDSCNHQFKILTMASWLACKIYYMNRATMDIMYYTNGIMFHADYAYGSNRTKRNRKNVFLQYPSYWHYPQGLGQSVLQPSVKVLVKPIQYKILYLWDVITRPCTW